MGNPIKKFSLLITTTGMEIVHLRWISELIYNMRIKRLQILRKSVQKLSIQVNICQSIRLI